MSNSRAFRRKLSGRSGKSFKKSRRYQQKLARAHAEQAKRNEVAVKSFLDKLDDARAAALENLAAGESGDDVGVEVGGADDASLQTAPGEGL